MKYCSTCKRSWEEDFRVCPIDGSPLQEMPAGADPYVGRSVGSCRVVEKIADGELGPIYKAEEPVRGPVALQIIPQDKLGSPILLEAFGDAVKLAARLNHPNILRVYGMETAPDGTNAVLMECFQGTNLQTYRRQYPGITPQEAARIVRQAAEGVLAAHRSSMLHGALHPTRILIGPDGSVKVSGFHRSGVRSGADVFTATPETLPYLAPEQIGIVRDLPAPDYRADVYSLGVILYELLAGRLPYDAKNAQDLAAIMDGAPPLPPSFTNPNVPPLLARMVLRAIAKHPTERHASVDEFIRELDAACRQPLEPPRPSVAVPPPQYPAPSYPPPSYPPPPAEPVLYPPPPAAAPPSDLFAPPAPPRSDSLWPEAAQEKTGAGEGSVFSWFKTRVGARPKRGEPERAPRRDATFAGTLPDRADEGEERTVVVSGRGAGKRRSLRDTLTGFGWGADQDMTGTGALPRRRLSSKVYLGIGIGALLLLSIIFVLLYYSSSPAGGRLVVNSTPPGAQVYLNDEYRGSTPLPYTELPPGVYRVRLQLQGYETKLDTVEITERGDIQRDYVLVAQAPLEPTPPPVETTTTPVPPPSAPPKIPIATERFENMFRKALLARNFFAPAAESAWDALERWQNAEGEDQSPALRQARQGFCNELVAAGREKLDLKDFAAARELISQARSRNVPEGCYAGLQSAYDQAVTGTMNDLKARARAAMDRQNYVTPEGEENALRPVRLMLAISPQDGEARVLDRDIFIRAWDQAQAKSTSRQHQDALEILTQLKKHYPNPPEHGDEIDRRIATENRKLGLLSSMKVPFSVRVKHQHGRKYVLFGGSECTGILRADGFTIEYQPSTGDHGFKIAMGSLKPPQFQKNKITFQGAGVPEGRIELEPADATQTQAFAQLGAKIQEYQKLYAEYSKP